VEEVTTTTTNQSAPRSGFTGWLRRLGGRWRPVTLGQSYDEALVALLRVPSTGATDRVVLAAGEDPNNDRSPR
jgi:hypothetical protein